MPGRLLKFSLIFVLAQYHPIHIEPTPILKPPSLTLSPSEGEGTTATPLHEARRQQEGEWVYLPLKGRCQIVECLFKIGISIAIKA